MNNDPTTARRRARIVRNLTEAGFTQLAWILATRWGHVQLLSTTLAETATQ